MMHTLGFLGQRISRVSFPSHSLRHGRFLNGVYTSLYQISKRSSTTLKPDSPPNGSDENTSAKGDSNPDLFSYTSGRWLWDEEERLRERYKVFNVEALQKIACDCVNATFCVNIKKIGEGGFNKVFRLSFENGASVIARIPNPNAGPPRYTTASEVATMDFVSIL